jgi:hypothetical protein
VQLALVYPLSLYEDDVSDPALSDLPNKVGLVRLQSRDRLRSLWWSYRK